MENKIYEVHKSSIGGLDANVMALIAYLGGAILGFIPGVRYVAFLVPIIIYIIEKDSQFVKFHAMQSILLSAVGVILSIMLAIIGAIVTSIVVATGAYASIGIVSILAVLVWIIAIVLLVFFIIAAVKAYKYELYKMPLIGKLAEKIAVK
jgi:uncharacterized membrane protein